MARPLYCQVVFRVCGHIIIDMWLMNVDILQFINVADQLLINDHPKPQHVCMLYHL